MSTEAQECQSCGYGSAGPLCQSCIAEDKAAQWDAAQPMIEAMTELVESVRRMTRDGHPCGPTGGDDWFKIMMRRLDSIHRLLPQDHPE